MRKKVVKDTSCLSIRTLPCILPMPVNSNSAWHYFSQLVVSSVRQPISLALSHPLPPHP